MIFFRIINTKNNIKQLYFYFLSSIFIFYAPLVRADFCEKIPFLLVRPSGHTDIKSACNPAIDKSKCLEEKIISKFGQVTLPDNTLAWTLSPDRLDFRKKAILDKLENSPIISKINELKILARKIGNNVPVCTPNLIYLGKEKIVGMGPVFFDGLQFVLKKSNQTIDNNIYENLMAIEDASSPEEFSHIPFVPENLLTIESLENSGQLMLAVAHEMAHGLMQDLYGVKGLSEVLSHHHSRTGHFASALTDPALAWVEGFAEGFEAYLGEEFHHNTLTPHLDLYFANAMERNNLKEINPSAYWWSLLPAVWNNVEALGEISNLMSDFLTDERQVGISHNNFILKGQFINLYQKYQVVPSGLDSDQILSHSVETTEALFSKEGAVAHLIYFMLKENMSQELFEIVSQEKPKNAHVFVNLLKERLPSGKYEKLRPALNALFTDQGRKIVRDYLIAREYKDVSSLLKNLYQYSKNKLSDLPTPEEFPVPREFWVEFLNSEPLHVIINGRMDRVNLAVEPITKLFHFVRNFTESKELAEVVLQSLLNMQERRDLDTTKKWGLELLEESKRLGQIGSFDLSQAYFSVGFAIIDGHSCFLANFDSQKQTCWVGEENTSVSVYFAHQLYDYIQSGKARHDFFEQTEFGQKALDLYTQYLYRHVRDQLERDDSILNLTIEKLLIAKNWIKNSKLNNIDLRIHTLFNEEEFNEAFGENKNVTWEYWSHSEKRKEIQREVFETIPGLEISYNYWANPQHRDEAWSWAKENISGIKNASTYWSSAEKREEMKNYVAQQYFMIRNQARRGQEAILNTIPGAQVANEYWSNPQKRKQIYDYVSEQLSSWGEWAKKNILVLNTQ